MYTRPSAPLQSAMCSTGKGNVLAKLNNLPSSATPRPGHVTFYAPTALVRPGKKMCDIRHDR